MLEWWNDIRMLVARYLVASDQMERSGPVAAAVRQAGYVSEDEGSGEEDGSSLEQEGEEGEDPNQHFVGNGSLEHHEPAPSYSHPNGSFGYAAEKKDLAGPDTNGNGDLSRRSSRRLEKQPMQDRLDEA